MRDCTSPPVSPEDLGSPQLDWQPLLSRQKLSMTPQKPYCEQQTLSGHVVLTMAALMPHSAVASQLDQQASLGDTPFVPQYTSS